MVVLALRVSTEPLVVPGRRVIASGCMRARRVLTEPKVVCARTQVTRDVISVCTLTCGTAVLI